MKKLNLLIVLFTGLIILSCSNDSENSQLEQPDIIFKKLITESLTVSFGNFKRTFVYNSENKVSEFIVEYDGDDIWTPFLTKTVFNYENGRITSSTFFEDGVFTATNIYQYENNRLKKTITNDSEELNNSEIEFVYNSQGRISRFDYYYNEQLQETMNLEYDSDGNLILATNGTDTFSFEFDQSNSAFSFFSETEKIIFSFSNLYENISNNNMTSQVNTYNVGLTNETISNMNTTIVYDNDNYPISKTTIKTFNGISTTDRTIVYEYE